MSLTQTPALHQFDIAQHEVEELMELRDSALNSLFCPQGTFTSPAPSYNKNSKYKEQPLGYGL